MGFSYGVVGGFGYAVPMEDETIAAKLGLDVEDYWADPEGKVNEWLTANGFSNLTVLPHRSEGSDSRLLVVAKGTYFSVFDHAFADMNVKVLNPGQITAAQRAELIEVARRLSLGQQELHWVLVGACF